MDILSVCPLRATSIVWQPRRGSWILTLVVKATFRLTQPEATLAEEQEYPSEEENHWNDDAARSLYSPSDLVPFKPSPEVLLVGHAFSPRGEPTAGLMVRLVVGDVDKSIEVHGDQSYTSEGGLREGPRFAKMPLRYERAAGGAETRNPVGMRLDSPNSLGVMALPNLRPPGSRIGSLRDFVEPVGFGPIAADWPTRRERRARVSPEWSPASLSREPLPEGLAPHFFQAAPADQMLAALRPDERIVLEHLHPEHARLTTALPGIEPRAFVVAPSGSASELKAVLDTLWIDTDRSICTLTWRAQVQLESPTQPGRVVVAMEKMGRPLAWGDVEPRARRGGAAPAPSSPSLPPLAPPTTTPAIASDQAPSYAPMPPRAHTLPFAKAPAPASEPARSASWAELRDPGQTGARRLVMPPAETRGGATSSTMEISPDVIQSVLRGGPPGPIAAPPIAAPPPIAVPPPSPMAALPSLVPAPPPMQPLPIAPAAPAARPSSPWAGGAGLGGLGSFGATPLGAPAAPAPVFSTPAPAPFQPAAPVAVVEAAAPASSPAPVAASTPAGVSWLPAEAKLGAARASSPMGNARSAGGLSNAAAVSSAASEAAAAEAAAKAAAEIAPGSPLSSASRGPARDHVSLLWFDPAAAVRIRAGKLLGDEPVTRGANGVLWLKEEAAPRSEPQEQRDRREVQRALTRGQALDEGGLEEAVSNAFRDDGSFEAPLALVAGELAFAFDELETLKATITVTTPFAGLDKKLKDLIAAGVEVLKSEWQVPGDVAEGNTRRIEEAFAQGPRAVAPGYLQTAVEKILLEGRRYQKKVLLGEPRIRALFTPGGGKAAIPAYLPEALGPKLPLFRRFNATGIVEILPQEDQYETHQSSLLVLALGRQLHRAK